MTPPSPIRSIRFGHTPNCSSLGNVLNVLMWTQAVVTAVWVAAERWEARRRRPEPDGGETRRVDEPPALVRTGEGGGPLEAHVQVTRACSLPCPSCHMSPAADGDHVPLDVVDARLRALAEAGVMRVAIGGGEVLRHPQLADLPARARAAGVSVGVTTSGLGGDADALVGFDQVNVSLDGLGETYRMSRGYEGADRALGVVRRLAAAGTRVGVNVVLDRDTFPRLAETVAAAVAAGAGEVQLLRLKPAGRARERYLDRRLTPEQAQALWPTARALMATHPDVSFRIDCALVPFLAGHDVDPERLAAFGFWGCHGADALLSVDTAGAAHPCSFVDEVVTAPPGTADPRWRAGVTDGPCGTCVYQRVCRGGCHAVAGFLTGAAFSPDPECPRVLAARSAA